MNPTTPRPTNDNFPEVISRSEAKARGLVHYFTGKPCKRGHLSVRTVSNLTCRDCSNALNVARYKENPDSFNARSKRWRTNNPDAARQSAANWNASNPSTMRAARGKWTRNNPAKVLAKEARRRASELNATPPWLTREHLAVIESIYAEARRLTAETGEQHHVDHIIPLKGKLVCGLHVPWNLRPLPANDNLRKSNKFDPHAA